MVIGKVMLCFASFCFDLFSHVLFCFVTTLFCFDPLRFVWVSIQFVQQSNNQSKYGEKYTIHKRDRQQVDKSVAEQLLRDERCLSLAPLATTKRIIMQKLKSKRAILIRKSKSANKLSAQFGMRREEKKKKERNSQG